MRIVYLVLVMMISSFVAPARAHEIGMLDLTLTESSPGLFQWTFGTPLNGQRSKPEVTPVWPEGCVEENQTLRCSEGLVGHLGINGLGQSYSVAILRIHWQKGEETVHTLTVHRANVPVFGGPSDSRAWDDVAKAYFFLGIEHILTGSDHLLFVISLLCLVGFHRQLLATITAFTLAHSITLILSALGWLTIRSMPTEACIALSIVFVASEAISGKETLTKRWPMLVAFVFGLVHGLGFAGALKDTGLPDQHLPAALLTFNLGVEAGQVLVLAVASLVTLTSRRLGAGERLRRWLLYGVGAVATYWSLARLTLLFG